MLSTKAVASRPSDDPLHPGVVRIEGGPFRMGSDHHYPEEAPAHRIAVDSFWIDTSTSHLGFRCIVREQGPA